MKKVLNLSLNSEKRKISQKTLRAKCPKSIQTEKIDINLYRSPESRKAM